MHCYVYKGDKHDDHFLYLPNEIEADKPAEIPPALVIMLGELALVVDFELTADRRLPQADVSQVIRDLQTQGFHLQMPKKDLRVAEERYFN